MPPAKSQALALARMGVENYSEVKCAISVISRWYRFLIIDDVISDDRRGCHPVEQVASPRFARFKACPEEVKTYCDYCVAPLDFLRYSTSKL